ncbi:hypothetical protein GOB57_10100 [Sinorhizobium meliloti]|nr:hypothetical protein [Sinorhizobium meliloti]
MKLAKPIFVVAIALLLTGCDLAGEPRLDTSSDDALRQSIEEMSADLSDADRERLAKTLMLLAFDTGDGESGGLLAMVAFAGDPGRLASRIGERANGLTAQEVIALGDAIKNDRTRERVSLLRSDIRTLEEYFAGLENQMKLVERQLGYLEIASPRYYWHEGSLGDEPVLDFHIKNNSGQAISKIRFRGIVTSHGRSVPWIDDTFSFEFKGGLESLESQHLKLTPGLGIGDWSNIDLKERTDLVLALETIKVELAGGGVVEYPKDSDASFKKAELEQKRSELAELTGAVGS